MQSRNARKPAGQFGRGAPSGWFERSLASPIEARPAREWGFARRPLAGRHAGASTTTQGQETRRAAGRPVVADVAGGG